MNEPVVPDAKEEEWTETYVLGIKSADGNVSDQYCIAAFHNASIQRVLEKKEAVGANTVQGQMELLGVSLIAAERQRQIEQEKRTPEHDNKYNTEELSLAAACYATPGHYRENDHKFVDESKRLIPKNWPWAAGWWKPMQGEWTPEKRIKELVKSGALIAAEIDRLKRRYVLFPKTSLETGGRNARNLQMVLERILNESHEGCTKRFGCLQCGAVNEMADHALRDAQAASDGKEQGTPRQLEKLRSALEHYARRYDKNGGCWNWKNYVCDSMSGEVSHFDWHGDEQNEPWEIAELVLSENAPKSDSAAGVLFKETIRQIREHIKAMDRSPRIGPNENIYKENLRAALDKLNALAPLPDNGEAIP